MEENNDIEGSIQIDTQADITPEYNPETTPQHKNIDIEILSSQVSQRTLVYQRALEKQPVILIMEIFAKGDNSYLHMPMRDLFFRIRHISDTIESNSSPILQNNHKSRDKNHRRKPDAISEIQFRDLRRLEYQFTPQEEPTVLVRRHCVLISLDPIRVVIMADRIILIVPDGADNIIQLLCIHMQAWVRDSTAKSCLEVELPFETRAYEAVFGTVIEIQKQELKNLSKKINTVTLMFKKSSILPIEAQEDMRQLKYTVTVMLERVKRHKQIIEELMDDDDAMALMNLTPLKNLPSLYNAPLVHEIVVLHEDMEALLESFLMDYIALENQLRLLQKKMESSEDMVLLRLDTSRNQLLITNTVLAVIACMFAGGGFVGSIWGMNLDSKLQETPGMFWGITGGTLGFMITTASCVLFYLKYSGVIPARLEGYKKVL